MIQGINSVAHFKFGTSINGNCRKPVKDNLNFKGAMVIYSNNEYTPANNQESDVVINSMMREYYRDMINQGIDADRAFEQSLISAACLASVYNV